MPNFMSSNEEIGQKNKEMTSGEMKSELVRSFEELQSRNDDLNDQEMLNKNNIKEIRTKTIQSLFSLLEDFGVDASNLESINAFLSKLREQSPDLAEIFEIAFTDLTSEVENEQKQEEVVKENEYKDAGMMNKFRNLSPQVLQGIE